MPGPYPKPIRYLTGHAEDPGKRLLWLVPPQGVTKMTCAKRVLVLLSIAVLGAWGCVPSASHSANADRLRAMEVKNAKLEDDFRAVAATRDQLRKQLAE